MRVAAGLLYCPAEVDGLQKQTTSKEFIPGLLQGVLRQRFLYISRDNGGVTVGRAVSQMKRFLTKSSTLSPRKQPGPVSSSALVESSNSRVF